MEKIVILGTSRFAVEMLDLVEDTGQFKVMAFVENWDKEKAGGSIMDRPVVWIDEAKPFAQGHKAVCCLGTTKRYSFIEHAAGLGFEFARIIHPTARLSKMSKIGPGSILSTGVVVASNTAIGSHVMVNRGVLVGHDTVIDDYATISPGSNIAGFVEIGQRTYIGLGAKILDGIKIGSRSLVGAGALVTKDVPDQVQVMGFPAKIIKENIDGR